MDQSPVEKIKERLNITDIIAEYIKVEKAGVNYKALCPFHNEKTPSFFISPARQNYHCFGCGASGDVISFVQEIEGLDFPQTLEKLAIRAGVELKNSNFKQTQKNDHLFKLLEEATKYYQQQLRENSEALKYLQSRGLSEETIKSFRLGLAPADWQNVSRYLGAKGWKEKEMTEAGLVLRSASTGAAPNGKLYDRFRSRIIFPLSDGSGRIVGFSGRMFGEDDGKTAKYINSPATVLYDKSRVLYGLDRAKLAIRQKGYSLLMEGQMDVLLSHQAGFAEAIAVSGTALTESHLEMIKRLSDTVIMAFDADSAGVSASARAVDLALMAGFEVRAIRLPEGTDPADIIKTDIEKWKKIIAQPIHIIDFYLLILSERYADRRELSKAVREQVYPYIARLAYQTDQAYFVAKTADILHLPEETVWADFQKSLNVKNESSFSDNKKMEKEKTTSKIDLILQKLAGLWWWQENVKNGITPAELNNKFNELMIENWADYLTKKEEFKSAWIMKAENIHAEDTVETLKEEINELIKNFNLEILRQRLEKARLSLRSAEATNDNDSVDKLLKECQTISQTINKIK